MLTSSPVPIVVEPAPKLDDRVRELESAMRILLAAPAVTPPKPPQPKRRVIVLDFEPEWLILIGIAGIEILGIMTGNRALVWLAAVLALAWGCDLI